MKDAWVAGGFHVYFAETKPTTHRKDLLGEFETTAGNR